MTAMRLPDAEWRRDAGLLRVMSALGGPDMTRVVGGAVRDALAGDSVSDIDLATRLHPPDVISRLDAAGIKAVPTGIAHGTITAVADGRAFEVTTLRRDIATDGRRATIAYTDDWAEDAARRDFTINAIYADPASGELYDPVGGLADLAARRVRFIGDAGARIDEDHLRILRWFRFVGRFDATTADAGMLHLMTQRAPQLRGLSRERIADELLRILALPDPAATVMLMAEAGVLAEIMPEALPGAPSRLSTLLAAERAAGVDGDAARRLIAVLPVDAARADAVAARLKLSNRLRKRIAVARGGGIEPDARTLAYHLGVEGAYDRLLLAGEAARLAMLAGWTVPRRPFSGGDLVACGVDAGPEVARLLHLLEARWIAAGFPQQVPVADWLAQARS